MTLASSTLEFDEFDRRGQLVTLSAEGALGLTRTGLVDVVPAGRERWRILPNGRVGSVRVEDLAVRVMPHAKLGLTQLFFLLDHGADKAIQSGAVSARHDDELWFSVASSLARLAQDALATGLVRGYRRVDDSLQTIRGRIRMGDQIRRRPGMIIPIEVTYSEFTPDIPENRIVRTAAHRLQFLPDLPDAIRRRLSIISAQLSEAELIPMGTPVPSWTPSRLNAKYHDVLALAERIVKSMSVEVEDGTAATSAFVTTMPSLFEAFVEAELTEALTGSGGRLRDNPLVHLDATHDSKSGPVEQISVRTGLVYEVDGAPVTTFVPTYPSTRGQERAEEHYRLLAACTALGVDRAYLVYPALRRGDTPLPRRIVHTDISIIEYPVDMSTGPAGTRAQLRQLADSARKLGG